LRQAFSRWGRPETIRVDNGSPWGSKGDFPSELALWLIGLGIGMIWNTPRRPQENGVVERSQGTGARWCEPQTCETVAYFPGLAHSGRIYSRESEVSLWDWNRVTTHLSGYVSARRVNEHGAVSIYNRGDYVGRAFHGQDVYVTFDPETNEWVFSDASGRELRHKTAKEMSPERVMALDVTDRRE
jgi:hypothetical protein